MNLIGWKVQCVTFAMKWIGGLLMSIKLFFQPVVWYDHGVYCSNHLFHCLYKITEQQNSAAL